MVNAGQWGRPLPGTDDLVRLWLSCAALPPKLRPRKGSPTRSRCHSSAGRRRLCGAHAECRLCRRHPRHFRSSAQVSPATAHRRAAVPDQQTLKMALAELRTGGVEHILLIAGDAPRPIGNSPAPWTFSGPILEESGIARSASPDIRRATTHPDAGRLWEALRPASMGRALWPSHAHRDAIRARWRRLQALERELVHRRIRLPVRLGIAGQRPSPNSRTSRSNAYRRIHARADAQLERGQPLTQALAVSGST